VPDVKLAESLTVPPTVTELADGTVAIAGLALVIVRENGVVDAEDLCVVSPP
jgi:hypothetical protein